MNKKALEFFAKIASESCTSQTPKLAHNTDYTGQDAAFILQFCKPTSAILDLGTGTGLIVNKIYKSVANIDCVEPQENFSRFIVQADNVTIHNCTAFAFATDKRFDIITLFGLMNYFSEAESIALYRKIKPFLRENATLIIKNQFGINEDVIVDGYSEEQKMNYYSSYRHLGKEISILESLGYKDIRSHDIYPPEANRWDNTHFYALTATV